MKLKLLAGLVACLVLGACASGTVKAPDAQQTVFGLEGVLTSALQIATTYAQLPICGVGAPVVCSDPATVVRIKTAAPIAVSAVQTAQAAVTNGALSPAAQAAAVATATQAVTALSSLTSSVRIS